MGGGDGIYETDIEQMSDKQLQQLVAHLEFALKSSHATVWNWDVRTDNVLFLPPSQTLYNESIDSVDGFLDQVHPEDREKVEAALQSALDGSGEYAVEFRTTIEGHLRWVADQGRVQFDADGNPIRMIGVAQDITSRKRYTRIISHVLRHRLRNEMNIVRGYASDLASALDDDALSDKAQTIQATADELVQLGETASQLTSIIQGAPPQVTRDLSGCVEELCTNLNQVHSEADIEVSTPGEVLVTADETLDFVLQQVIENAIVHNPSPTVEVTVERSPPRVRIADDGNGLPAVEQQALDDNNPITHLTHGAGLGLTVVKWGVEALEGDLDVSTSDEEGTIISIALPPLESQKESGNASATSAGLNR